MLIWNVYIILSKAMGSTIGILNWKHCSNKLKHIPTKNVTLTLPNTNHPLNIFVVSASLGVGCVPFQKVDIRTLDNILYISLVFTTNEQKFCTTHRDLIGIVLLPKKYQHEIKGCDHFIFVLIQHKPIFSRFTKQNVPPLIYTAQRQLTNFRNFVLTKWKGKNFL